MSASPSSTAKSEKFQKFQHLALEVKVETSFKELIWKPRCEQVILWEKREEFKVKDNSNQLTNKVKDLQMGKVNRLQKSVFLIMTGLELEVSFIEYL
ncbi:hypothetical protein RhiirC2_791373 [Rhizophagus irregularis]|uniref:Uncharacterized protein n=1 Tax=Rhizophagus irregularis TaxID=588596 RepID=A0A2N1MJC0_9GLOM|nr:hypothetical protein RhiirC2_791373 [Rhizophagus irregularis]